MFKKVLASVLIVLGLLYLNFTLSTAQNNLVGQEFKEINATGWINSEPIKVADLKGKVVILEFWATWCPPCKKSIPHLIELYNKYKDKNVVLVALTDEPQNVAEPFAKEMGMPYPIGVGSTTGNDYGVTGIPTAVIIGPDQKIAWVGHPLNKEFEPAIEKALAHVNQGEVKTQEAKVETTAEVKVNNEIKETVENNVQNQHKGCCE